GRAVKAGGPTRPCPPPEARIAPQPAVPRRCDGEGGRAPEGGAHHVRGIAEAATDRPWREARGRGEGGQAQGWRGEGWRGEAAREGRAAGAGRPRAPHGNDSRRL